MSACKPEIHLVVDKTDLIDDLPVTVFAKNRIPTADQVVPTASYLDWKKEDTEIITYTVGNNIYKGIKVETRDEAKAHCELTRGTILEANYVPGRAFYRVFKVKK